MKELSIEEKAKRYDEAFEIARLELQERGNEPDGASILSKLFPELKESEDERIRTKLLNLLKELLELGGVAQDTWSMNDCEQFIAWIEKQCEPNPYSGVSFNYNGNTWGMCARDNGVDILLDKQLLKHLEKQGEQKPVGCPEYCVISNCANCPYHPVLIKKPTDNVEPKFKVGDWIAHNEVNFIFRVVSIGSHGYGVINRDNYTKAISFNNEENYHLWTIQDAKDGDVLCCESGWTCIFKALDNHTNTFSSYCFMDSDKWFCNTGSECHTLDKAFIKAYNGEIHPATKEQRDLLFSKMKESGYMWDAEKKELKKIESANIPENFEKYVEHLLNLSDGEGHGSPAKVKEVSAELLKLAKLEHKPAWSDAWSEEDEKGLGDALWAIQQAASIAKDENDMGNIWFAEDWLKSLKDRVQPKQEWSEEDERIYKSITYSFAHNYPLTVQQQEFVKSLRPQTTWKPSDEQMRVLDLAINGGIYHGTSEETILLSLFNDLKNKFL